MATYQDLPARDIPPTRPMRQDNEDDVMRQPGTLIAMFLAVGLIVGIALLYVGSTYGPSRVIQTDPVVVNAPTTPTN